MNTPSKFELHYYFNDSSHTMDAVIRNECEREVLKIFEEVISSLDFDISIESEALYEGGLKEIWSLLGKNSPQITLILAVFTVIISRLPVENTQLVELQIENLRLDNELKQTELKEVKERLKSEEEVTTEIVEEVISKLEKDYKIIWHKSNFYKKLNNYPKVTKLTTQKLDKSNKPIEEESTVNKLDFSKFILRSDEFPPIIDEKAIIDIISPVIKKGNFQWKGFYNGEIISFQMNDKLFKESVIKKDIEFVNGTAIKCVLQQLRKIDDLGLIRIKKNKVLTVLEIIQDYKREETTQGKKYIRDKDLKSQQTKLDF